MDKAPNWEPVAAAAGGSRLPTFEAVRHDLAQVPKARLIVTTLFVIIAILLARYSWGYPAAPRSTESAAVWVPPIAVDAERALYDTRVLYAMLRHPIAQDDRIVMIVYTQEMLAATAKRSPLDRTILAKALTSIDALGPKAIGIDILIDQPQPEDETLLTAMRAMRTPVWLAYATNASNANDVELWQQAFMDRWHARLSGSQVRRAAVRTEADSDNVLRSWPTADPALPPFLPIAMAGLERARSYDGSVKYRAPADLERPVFATLPIDLFADPASAAFLADQVRGKLFLIGGDLPDRIASLSPRRSPPEPTFPAWRTMRR